jgi:hypothetical protein
MKREKESYCEDKMEKRKKLNTVKGNNPRELDQFFTKPDIAIECVSKLSSILKDNITCFDSVLEPSFGNGVFVDALQAVDVLPPKLKYIDIDAVDKTHCADFLKYKSDVASICLTIGNPPFGKNSSLAISFFNHAAKFSACIAFILPRTFSKTSIHRKLDLHFFLIYEEILNENGFIFKEKDYDVPCVFQVWTHSKFFHLLKNPPEMNNLLRGIPPKISETFDFKFVKSSENPDLAIRRVGVNAGKIFKENPSKCSQQSHYFLKYVDPNNGENVLKNLEFLQLDKIDSKYQTAGNPSISKNELCQEYLKNFLSVTK